MQLSSDHAAFKLDTKTIFCGIFSEFSWKNFHLEHKRLLSIIHTAIQDLKINLLRSFEIAQGLERLWYHFYDESNSKRRSIETVYLYSTNGFELLFVWWLWIVKPYIIVSFSYVPQKPSRSSNSLNNVIILKTLLLKSKCTSRSISIFHVF